MAVRNVGGKTGYDLQQAGVKVQTLVTETSSGLSEGTGAEINITFF